jgi:hypothetical protein
MPISKSLTTMLALSCRIVFALSMIYGGRLFAGQAKPTAISQRRPEKVRWPESYEASGYHDTFKLPGKASDAPHPP